LAFKEQLRQQPALHSRCRIPQAGEEIGYLRHAVMWIARLDHRSRTAATAGGTAGQMTKRQNKPPPWATGGGRFISNVQH
jgi:hypothetical protein